MELFDSQCDLGTGRKVYGVKYDRNFARALLYFPGVPRELIR